MPGFDGVLPPLETTVPAVPTVSGGQPSAQHLQILADIRAKHKLSSAKWWSDRGIEQISLLDFINNIFK